MVRTRQSLAEFQEGLHVINDKLTGAQGIIAIHSTTLGPAAGGCRLWHYPSADALAQDAMRLSRGMSYKNALAGLPFGGGKAVLQRPAGEFDRDAFFRAFADAVAALEGNYITAEDVGTTVADMTAVRARTPYVAGLERAPGMAGGDPSPWTALGVFLSMEVAAETVLGAELRDLTVAVQGVGNVGATLCRLLDKAGARLIVADLDAMRAKRLAEELGATAMKPDAIVGAEADVLAPCALGGVIDAQSVERLRARIVCGGANNQLAIEEDGFALLERGITYAPDYLVNAGGIINVAAEYLGETSAQVRERVERIPMRLREVLAAAASNGEPPHRIADQMAETIISRHKLAA